MEITDVTTIIANIAFEWIIVPSQAPAIAPITVATSKGDVVFQSMVFFLTRMMVAMIAPTVRLNRLVALAWSAVRPSASKTGRTTVTPPPAKTLSTPERRPIRNVASGSTMKASHGAMGSSRGCGGNVGIVVPGFRYRRVDAGGVDAAGEIEMVSHVFQPRGRCAASNSL